MQKVLYLFIIYGLYNSLVQILLRIPIEKVSDIGLWLFYIIPPVYDTYFFILSIIFILVSIILIKYVNKYVVLLTVISNLLYIGLWFQTALQG